MQHLRTWIVMGALGTLSAQPAHAKDPEDAATEMARERFNEGVKYFDASDFEKARLAFLQAYALRAHPAVLLNLAQSELRADHAPEAASHFSQYLREHDAKSQDAKSGLARAKSKVLEVKVTADVEEMIVFVDRKEVGRTPLPDSLYLAPGAHSLEGKHEDQVVNVTVEGDAGSTRQASLVLGTAPATEPPPVAKEPESAQTEPKPPEHHYETESFIDWYASTPGAWVLTLFGVGGAVGGTVLAVASNTQSDLSETRQEEIVTNYANDQAGVDSEGNPLTPPYAPLAGQTVPVRYVTPGSCVVQHSDPSRQQQFNQACQQYNDATSLAATYQDWAIGVFVAAGVSLVAIPVYYFIDRDEAGEPMSSLSARAQARVVPVVAPGYQGISILGSF